MPRLSLVLCALGGLTALCTGASLAFILAREWWWDRDRSRRVAAMLERERENTRAAAGLHGLMTVQLAEIRSLPEVREKRPV